MRVYITLCFQQYFTRKLHRKTYERVDKIKGVEIFSKKRAWGYALNVEYITCKCRLSLFLELESKFKNIETIQNLLPDFFARVCTKTFTTEEMIRAKQFIKADISMYVYAKKDALEPMPSFKKDCTSI